MNTKNNKPSSQATVSGEDPFALTENCDYPPPSKTQGAAGPVAVKDKPVEEEDDVAIPTPIATLVFQDGRTEPVYRPLAGHEHLFKARPMISSQTSFSGRVQTTHRPIQPASTHVPETSQRLMPVPRRATKPEKQPTHQKLKKAVTPKQGLLKSKSLKRTRSIAQGLASNQKVKEDSEELDDDDQTVQAVTEESYTFYIGDIEAFKDFLRRRFDELTMKPLRGIATHWVKLLEPRRLGDWGKYHEMLPSEADTPPWWPRTVIYKEPSHLKKSELSTLAVEMMLVHRKIDEIKRKGSWIAKLRDVAKFTVQTTSADHFSSAKGAVHSEEMKKRALEQILPSIFDVAQAYEDHIMQYSLFEGSGNADPGRGKHHTWKPIPRPARRTAPKRPRRTIVESPEIVHDTICEASGDETEPDDTMVRLARAPYRLPQAEHEPRPMTAQSQPEAKTSRQLIASEDSRRQTWATDTSVSASGPCTPVASQDDCKIRRTMSTPNSSFDQSLHGLHLEEEDLDKKPFTRAMSDHGNVHPQYNMAPYTQQMQMEYPAAHSSFEGQPYQPANTYPTPAQAHYTQTDPGFINPFSMYNAPPPPMGYTQYASPMPTINGFAYEQNIFPSTPISMPMTPSDPNASFHGLPSDYSVDPRGLHHF